VQRPHEPPSGEWSEAGIKTGEYESKKEQSSTEKVEKKSVGR